MTKEVEIDKEGMDNLVAVFSLLLKWDREQNPHLYQKIKIPPKSLGNVPDKQTSIMSENS
jgi:hypothetical protein